MTQPTLIIDMEGEVIIFLKCPESLFAPWNEDVADPEPLESHGDVQKTDSGDNATQEGIHNKSEMDESTDNPAETLEPADTAMQSAAEIVDDSVTESANGPTTEPLDEQLQEARLDASLDGSIENGREIDFEVALQEPESDEHMRGDCFRIQVSAKHLTLASPIFKETLSGRWEEGLCLLKEGSVEIPIRDWDLEAFLILMNIFHCQVQKLPREVCLELLAKIAVLADCYQCQPLVRFFAEIWIGHLRRNIFPTIYSRDSMLWVWVSWNFRQLFEFEKSTSIAISQSNGLITSLDLPIPAKVIAQSRQVFEFTEIDEIYPALLNLRRQTSPFNAKITHDHLRPLKKLAQNLNAGAQALENAYKLGTGYDDLAVVLLEPSDKADTHCFDEMLNTSMALKAVDSSLRHTFNGQRSIQDTIILDIRAFQSDSIRQTQRGSDKLRADELAYTAFEQILCDLRPDVILVCQCQTNTNEVGNQFARQVCSSIDEATDISVLRLPWTQHESVMVKSFHPMYLEYMREAPNNSATKAVLQEYLFDAGFIIASNALAGRRITGYGLHNLKACARDGLAFIFTPQGVRHSYLWPSGSQFADTELVKKLKVLETSSEDENTSTLESVFSMLRIRSDRGRFGNDNAAEREAFQKDDILEEIGPIPKLPQGIIPLCGSLN
ncbi:hypothetical protein KXV66_004218 [Aspergillus fumigatus]|nr:hypothetical protein KXV66_004218 [Aspergillus fumigatus]